MARDVGAMSDVRGTPVRVGEVVGGMLQGRVRAEADANRRMLATWLMANGDRERAHTVGVWVRDAPDGGPPTLVVYVDSSACVVDFRSQREIYLARMEAAGVPLAALEVRLSKYAGRHREVATAAQTGAAGHPTGADERDPLPSLSDAEEAQILKMTENLPDNLQKAAYKAISTSLRRDKKEQSDK